MIFKCCENDLLDLTRFAHVLKHQVDVWWVFQLEHHFVRKAKRALTCWRLRKYIPQSLALCLAEKGSRFAKMAKLNGQNFVPFFLTMLNIEPEDDADAAQHLGNSEVP